MYKTSSSPVHSERPEESAVSAEATRTIVKASCMPMRNIAAAEPSAPFAGGSRASHIVAEVGRTENVDLDGTERLDLVMPDVHEARRG